MSHRGAWRPSRGVDLRAELARQYRRVRRLRLATTIAALVGLLVAGAVTVGAERWTRDPGFAVLDEVTVPVLEVGTVRDTAWGNRWCIGQCRVRERVWLSTAAAPVTVAALNDDVTDRGWRPVGSCASPADVSRLCLQRDEFRLEMWVAPNCDAGEDCARATVTALVRQATGPAPGVSGSAVRSTLLVRAS